MTFAAYLARIASLPHKHRQRTLKDLPGLPHVEFHLSGSNATRLYFTCNREREYSATVRPAFEGIDVEINGLLDLDEEAEVLALFQIALGRPAPEPLATRAS